MRVNPQLDLAEGAARSSTGRVLSPGFFGADVVAPKSVQARVTALALPSQGLAEAPFLSICLASSKRLFVVCGRCERHASRSLT